MQCTTEVTWLFSNKAWLRNEYTEATGCMLRPLINISRSCSKAIMVTDCIAWADKLTSIIHYMFLLFILAERDKKSIHFKNSLKVTQGSGISMLQLKWLQYSLMRHSKVEVKCSINHLHAWVTVVNWFLFLSLILKYNSCHKLSSSWPQNRSWEP